MSRISNTETAILGLLYEHQHYAYRLEEIMDKRSMHDWSDLEYSSIEDVLKKLEKKSLIEIEYRKTVGQPLRKIYSVTSKGKLVFLDKIKELMSNRERIIYPFDLAIANMDVLSHEEVIQSLNTYLKSIDKRIEFLDGSIKFQEENKVPFNFIAIFSRSSALLKAEREWIEDFMEKVKENV
ncbi:MAG: PadR family transcriptional regulator [Methanobacterium sp.]